MKVLLLNVNAIAGSTGKIVTDIKMVLEAQGHECMICYGANETIKAPGYKRICSEPERKINAALNRFSGLIHGGFLPCSFSRFKRIFEQWRPDIVHIHCPNGYILDLFKVLKYLASKKQKTILTNHSEFFYTGGCEHAYDCDKWLSGCFNCQTVKSKLGFDASRREWNKFKQAFDMFDIENLIVTSVSPWLANRSSQSPALGRFKNETILNGINTKIFHPCEVSKSVKVRLQQNKPIILHVTASFTTEKTSLKGGYWIREIARQLPEFNFVVACSYCAKTESLPPNILIWGRTKTQEELAELYNAADLTIITSRRETFSMVVAESLCCGTPVVGFKAGGPESIALKEYTSFVDYGNVEKLVDKVRCYIKQRHLFNREYISRKSIQLYSKEAMSNNYMGIYFEIQSC